MRALYSWIWRVSARKHFSPPRHSTLLNPADTPSTDVATVQADMDGLEDQLICWLFSTGSVPRQSLSAHDTSVLRELARRVEENRLMALPRQPLSLPKLMRALSDEATERNQLAKIILSDPTLTDQLLRAAKSSYFRVCQQSIESVDQAIFLLGVDGVKTLASAAIMRPLLSARNGQETQFAQRVWRWGLACGHAVEGAARVQGAKTDTHFIMGLLPALVYMTLCREVMRIHRGQMGDSPVPLHLIQLALQKYQWATAQALASSWNLPPQVNAYLLAAERPVPRRQRTPLNDGIILGTCAVLELADLPVPAERELRKVLSLTGSQVGTLMSALRSQLKDNKGY